MKKNCIKSDFREIVLKLATNGQSDKGFLLTSTFVPGAKYMYKSIKIYTWSRSQLSVYNTTGPLVKIQKIQHFDTVRESSLFEMAIFHEQIHFITKAHDWRNRSTQKSTFFLHDSGRFGSKCLLSNTQCKFLLILKMGVPVIISASWMQFTELW